MLAVVLVSTLRLPPDPDGASPPRCSSPTQFVMLASVTAPTNQPSPLPLTMAPI